MGRADVRDDEVAGGDAPRQLRALRLRADGEVNYIYTTTTDGHVSERVPTEEILFILDEGKRGEGAAGKGYLIARLHEQPEDEKNPFLLRLDVADEVDEPLLAKYGMKEVPGFLTAGHRLHVVVSTKSGTGLAPKFLEGVLRPLLQALTRNPEQDDTEGYHVLITQSTQSVRDFARSRWAARRHRAATTATPETIILLSGDGGVVDLLNGSDDAAPPTDDPIVAEPGTSLPTIALLPLGTANALFHSLHKPLYDSQATNDAPPPSPFVLALRSLFRGRPHPLPSFRASFSPGSRLVSYTSPGGTDTEAVDAQRNDKAVTHLYGAIVASYGFHAQLVWESDTPEYRKHGAARFGMVAESLLQESHAYLAEVRVADGEQQARQIVPCSGAAGPGEARFSYVLATMVSNLERTFTISPDSKPLGDELRLVHFGDVGGERTMEIMKAAYAGGAHVGMSDVGYERVDGVTVGILEEDARWRKVCIDGTIVEIPRGGEMEVRRVEGALYAVLVGAHQGA